jgi:hypothetical protein
MGRQLDSACAAPRLAVHLELGVRVEHNREVAREKPQHVNLAIRVRERRGHRLGVAVTSFEG